MTCAAQRAPGPAAALRPIRSGLRLAYLVASVVGTALILSTIVSWTVMLATADERHGPPMSVLVVAIGSYAALAMTLALVGLIGVAWVYRAWSWLPVEQRYARNWRSWITPAQAALFLLVPFFQYYWMFVVNLGLCDALDRLRVMYPTRQAAPKQLALVGSILQIVFWPAALVFFYLFMRKVEQMTAEMSDVASARPVAPFRGQAT